MVKKVVIGDEIFYMDEKTYNDYIKNKNNNESLS